MLRADEAIAVTAPPSAMPKDPSMKAVAALLIACSSSMLAQSPAAVTAAKEACGAAKENFNTAHISSTATPTPIPTGKALIYVIETQDSIGICVKCGVTVKVGLDGEWRGATNGNSFFSFPVDPGDHHLCTTWQSRLPSVAKRAALAGFTAEAGKSYYFQTHVVPPNDKVATQFSVAPVNEDEGKLLIASSKLTESQKR